MAPLTLLTLPLEIIDGIIEQVLHLPSREPPTLSEVEVFLRILKPTKAEAKLGYRQCRFPSGCGQNNCAGLLLTCHFLRERTHSFIRTRPPKGYEVDVFRAEAGDAATWTWLPDWSPRTKEYISITLRHPDRDNVTYHPLFLINNLSGCHQLFEAFKLPCRNMLVTRQLVLQMNMVGPTLEQLETIVGECTVNAALVKGTYEMWVQYWARPRSRDDAPELQRVTIRFNDGVEWEWFHPGGDYPDNWATCTFMSPDTEGAKKQVFRGRA